MKEKYANIRPTFEKIAGLMEDYQKKAVLHLRKSKRVLLEAPTGSGKTLITLTAAMLSKPERCVILCSKNALWTWKKEITKWYPEFKDNVQIIEGNATKRKKLWSAQDAVFRVLTYRAAQADIEYLKAWGYTFLIADECHRAGVRNRKSKGAAFMQSVTKGIEYVFFVTATPANRGAESFWKIFNILQPKKFTSYWSYVNTYCTVEIGHFGKLVSGFKNEDKFAKETHDVYYKIHKNTLKDKLPEIIRDELIVPMSNIQSQTYNSFDSDMLQRNDKGELIYASTTMTKQLRLRQMLVTPRILGYNDYGPGLPAIVDLLQDLEEDHFVIFTPFKAAMEHIEAYLHTVWPKKKIFRLSGGLKMRDVQEVVESFVVTRGICICTTGFAESFELPSADVCFFLGYEFDDGVNMQCEGRLARMTRRETPVRSYFVKHTNELTNETVDDRVLEICHIKQQNIEGITSKK